MKGHLDGIGWCLDGAGIWSREEARLKTAKMVETRTKLLLFPLCPQPRGLSSVDGGGGMMAGAGLAHCQGDADNGGDRSGIGSGGDGNGRDTDITEHGGGDYSHHLEYSLYSMSNQVLLIP